MSRLYFSMQCKPRRLASFTLIELLTVIVIIAILMALTLAAASGVMKSAARSRARAEIKGMASALESYKIDNGAYPQSGTFNSTASYASSPSSPLYIQSSEVLYENLTGQTNFGDPPLPPGSTAKAYMTFQKGQLGNNSAGAGNPIYIQDPFGSSYGYFTGNGANAPNSGAGFFDLWSTGGDTTYTNLISNWGN